MQKQSHSNKLFIQNCETSHAKKLLFKSQNLFFALLGTFFLLYLLVPKNVSAESIKIMPLGDSITKGYGSTLSVGYRQKLFMSLVDSGYEVDFWGQENNGQYAIQFFDNDHEGHGGWTSYDSTWGPIKLLVLLGEPSATTSCFIIDL